MSSTNPVTFLDNLRKGMRVSTEVLLAGFDVFSPFIDFSLFFQCRGDEQITGPMIKRSSMAWLEVSEAILLVPGWENSPGTAAELARAQELRIPVFSTLETLSIYFRAVA